MSLEILKAGLLDTIQDQGRWGYQPQGINPGGAMDRFSSRMVNALLGQSANYPVIECHFPAPQILFTEPAIICIGGADFQPQINDQAVPLYHPVAVAKDAVLKWKGMAAGSRAYIAVMSKPAFPGWLDSYATHLTAGAGGWEGRALQTGDVLPYHTQTGISRYLQGLNHKVLHWSAHESVPMQQDIEVILGSEWHLLTPESQDELFNGKFQISNEANRMGYRLTGPKMQFRADPSMISAPVSFGTVQVLPGGQLILLMADHQTAGGYPRAAHVISAHLPILAQKKSSDLLRFKLTTLEEAEEKIVLQSRYIEQIKMASHYHLQAMNLARS